jgi:Na+/melibiose symporter-like transporter
VDIHHLDCTSAGTNFSVEIVQVYVIQFYEKLGASLSSIALFQALARGFDVITDPSMSYLTDSFRSKRGKCLTTPCLPWLCHRSM